VLKRLGSKFKPAIDSRPTLPQDWSGPDLAYLRSQIDGAQESHLGYSY
jgi:hypothetical protein